MKLSPLQEYRLLRQRLDALAHIDEADTPDAAFERLQRFLRSLSFSYAGFGAISAAAGTEIDDVVLIQSDPFFRTSLKDYTDRGLHEGDPVAVRIAQGQHTVVTSAAHACGATRVRNDTRAEIGALFGRYDIEDHVTLRVPTQIPGTIGIFAYGRRQGDGHGAFARLAAETATVVRAGAMLVLDKALRGDAGHAERRLTPVQARVLQGLAEGLSARQIAARDGRSLHTVRSHIRMATARLGAANTPQAIAHAIQLGEIPGSVSRLF